MTSALKEVMKEKEKDRKIEVILEKDQNIEDLIQTKEKKKLNRLNVIFAIKLVILQDSVKKQVLKNIDKENFHLLQVMILILINLNFKRKLLME